MNVQENEKVGIGRIAADLRGKRIADELRSAWSLTLLYRVPSLPFVWSFARLGIGPMPVTGVGLFIALSLPFLAWGVPLSAAPWAVVVAAVLFQILDCADGTLARVTGRTSPAGAEFDLFVDMVQWACLYIAIGLLADRTLGTGFGWTALALVAAWTRLFARMLRERLGGLDDADPAPLRLADLPIVFVSGLSGLFPFLALTGVWLGVAATLLLLYSLLDIGDALLPHLRP
ncbi:CDP-alcohol phosphatidyltransferase family protein [Pseudoruegeria sp. HB172150]|uniref:CDP-alcohol phosphatidyltransferase family protein n=1 Tax=Pseudoruegeria sp. HB172150 TaxID=2721164 RepID=UPI001C13245E|nr:CDP-alcohol phosphatidyltransferase family protein [Pseudoruegeria sp. HB172150]